MINKKINLFIFTDANQAQGSPDLSSPVLSRYKESRPEKVVLLNSYVKAAQGFWGKKIQKPDQDMVQKSWNWREKKGDGCRHDLLRI